MASIVKLGSVHELEKTLNVPPCPTRLHIKDIKVDSDTTDLFLQGRIKVIRGFVKHAKAPMIYKKITIEEEETHDQMHIMLTVEENLAEQFRLLKDDTLALGDLLVVVNVRIELDPTFPTQSGANLYQAIVNLSSSSCRVLLVKTDRDGTSSKHPEKLPVTTTAVVNQKVLNPKSQRREPYAYVKISNLVSSTTVNIFGVVKFVKDPCKTRGVDYSMLITLQDESAKNSDDKLKCILFGNSSKFPPARLGNIIRFHRLKINTFKDELQGQNGPGFSWVVFDGAVDAPLSPTGTSHDNNTITAEDLETVKRLRLWVASERCVLSQVPQSTSSLSSITTGQYFNLICQVVGTCVVNEGESLLLKVWDGTQVKLKLYGQDMASEGIVSRLLIDERLAKRVQRYLVDVWAFDDHFASAMEVKPGDFLKLQNLHAARHKPRLEEEADPESESVELCLHRGYGYGRRLTILDPASKEVEELRQRLDRELSAAAFDDSADSIDQLWNDACVAPLDVDYAEVTNRLIQTQINDGTSNSDDLGEYFTPLTQPQSALSPPQSNKGANTLTSDIKRNTLDGETASMQRHVIVGSCRDSTPNCTAAMSDKVTAKDPRHAKSAALENDSVSSGDDTLPSLETEIAVSVDERSGSSENNVTQSGKDILSSREIEIAVSVDERLGSSENNVAHSGKDIISSRETEIAVTVDERLGSSESNVAQSGKDILSSRETEIAVSVDERLGSSENNVAQSRDENAFSLDYDLAITGQEKAAETESVPLVELHSSSLGFAQDRCMLETATVMTGHHHIKVTLVADILRHSFPYKFRFQGYAWNYQPKSETASGFLRLYCDRCKYLSSLPFSDAEDQLESLELTETRRLPIFKCVEDEIKIYCCPDCNDVLEHIYMMEFLLNDGTGWIHVGLWRKHANHFFGCTPVDLLRNPSKYREIVEKLNLMCFGQRVVEDSQNSDDEEQSEYEYDPQKMECCLMSYQTPHGVAYQIFDTTFAVDS